MSEHLRAGVVVLISVFALAGCGNDASQSEPEQAQSVSEATTEEAEEEEETVSTEAEEPVTTEAENAQAVVPDRRGDTKAPDLDIIRGTVGREGDLLLVAITLAQKPTTDVIYSAFLSCADGDEYWQLGYKRAAGTTEIFAFDAVRAKQYEAEGDLTGRTVTVVYLSPDMGCDGPLDFQLVAEGTNDREPMTDYLPEPGPDALNPKQIRLP